MSELKHLSDQIVDDDWGTYFDWSEFVDEDGNDLDLITENPWEQEGKYQYQTIILQSKKTKKFYMFDHARSGSPFTDWHYQDPYIMEVEQYTETIEVTRYKRVEEENVS